MNSKVRTSIRFMKKLSLWLRLILVRLSRRVRRTSYSEILINEVPCTLLHLLRLLCSNLDLKPHARFILVSSLALLHPLLQFPFPTHVLLELRKHNEINSDTRFLARLHPLLPPLFHPKCCTNSIRTSSHKSYTRAVLLVPIVPASTSRSVFGHLVIGESGIWSKR